MSRRGWALPAATRIQSKHSESPPDALREDETQVLCVGILQVVMGAGALSQPGEPSPACPSLSQKSRAFLWPWLLSQEVGTGSSIGTRDLETMTSLHQNGLSDRVNNCRAKGSIALLLFPWQE